MSALFSTNVDRYANTEIIGAANVGYVPGDPSTYLDMPFITNSQMYSDGQIRQCSGSPNNMGLANVVTGSTPMGSLACAAPPQLADYNQTNPAVCNIMRRPDGSFGLTCKSNVTIM